MKNGPKIDLGLTAYDEMFMTDQERAEVKLPRIYDIPLDQIDDFPDHPFKVRLDEDMDQLVQSIKERGLITPITLRTKDDGRYEIVSGHRRKKACELAGLPTVKAEIREMSRWIADLKDAKGNRVGRQIPLHISRFFPRFHITDRKATDVKLVYRLAKAASEELEYVYTGNC